MSIEFILIGVQQGLILAIISFAIMVPFRFLNLPDLTVDGSYPFGAVIYAGLASSGFNQLISLGLGVICAGLMGIATSQVIIRMKVNSLLAGIILSTMAYSVNLRILGKPNIMIPESAHVGLLGILLILSLCVIMFSCFLYTEYGLLFRATGLNRVFAVKRKIKVNRNITYGFFFAAALSGLAGCLMVQIQQYADVGMGVGIVIHGLASLMIGEAILSNRTITRQLFSPVIGALIYQQIQGIVLLCGLAPSDLKFFTGLVVLTVIAMQKKQLKQT
ncbi:MAG: hypothetical protein RLN62_04110 [Rickettsiales bacterium]